MRLSLRLIVEAALTLQNREGLDAVTTRELAKSLEVTSAAIYRHVRSKEELLGHMLAVILTEAKDAMRPCAHWQPWLHEYARTLRMALLRYRDSAKMMLIAAPNANIQFDLVPAIYEPLLAWGFPEEDAIMSESLLASFVLGWVGFRQNAALRPILTGVFDLDAQFDRSVEMIIAGIERDVAGAKKLAVAH